jgi:hypothetical protein
VSESDEDTLRKWLTPLELLYSKLADEAAQNVTKMFAVSHKLHADAKAKDDAEKVAKGEPVAVEDNDEKHDLNGLISLTKTHLSLVKGKAKAAQVETVEGFIPIYLQHKKEWLADETSEIGSAELMMAFGAIDHALGLNKSFAGRVKKEDDGNPPLPSM